LGELEAIATEANHMRCQLKIPEGKPTLEKLILRSLWQLLHDTNVSTLSADIEFIRRLIEVGNQLNLGLSLAQCQELYFNCLQPRIEPLFQQAMQAQLTSELYGESAVAHLTAKTDCNTIQLRHLLQLGEQLAVDVSFWLSQLP
jgi:alpha-amylase/alpha-mannosidase (GH57 family)